MLYWRESEEMHMKMGVFQKYVALVGILFFAEMGLGALPLKDLPQNLGEKFRFDLMTPSGERIFRSSVLWESLQIDNPTYPKPAKCASNVTKVMDLSDLNQYRGESVGRLLKSVVDQGGSFIKWPKDKKGIIKKLNETYHGQLPVGTVVGGCLYSDCMAGKKGQRHAALVSNIGPDGVIYLYHNNWYRPENEGGARKPYMVSAQFLKLGNPRQWMQTPWIKIVRSSDGKIKDIIPQLPAIDDLDPTQYYISLVIPIEIEAEIANGTVQTTNPFSGSMGNNTQLLDILNNPDNLNTAPPSDIFDVDLEIESEGR
jgi:hypothetical protein